MADVASKQQTTALLLSTIVTRTRRHKEQTNLMRNLCCAREHSVVFRAVFLHSQIAQFNLECMGPLSIAYNLLCAYICVYKRLQAYNAQNESY
jgi:hypothetical protein